MTTEKFVEPACIRARFAQAMSSMYQAEVPQYGALIDLVADINQQTLADRPELQATLASAGELERLHVERHGAIRIGTAQELAILRRLFAVMGMFPVGYYDLSIAGVPVHSTAFRPIEKHELDRNPFRLFTSLLRLELIEDDALRAQAEGILRARDIFAPGVHDLIAQHEHDGGLNQAQADRFVEQALETFRWHDDSTVDYDTYQALRSEHPLVADVVCFRGPHINHLTPRTLDIDAAQAAMPARGITPKATIEGPPKRQHPILLRQTSFKALEEAIRFKGSTEGHHTARFGEIEQRGVALTPAGRRLYDKLLSQATAVNKSTNDGYQRDLARIFTEFPDDETELRRQGLAYFQFVATDKPMPNNVAPNDVDRLIEAGCLRATPIVYEDFLPVSAAGIFRSNLGDQSEAQYAGDAQLEAFADALGMTPIDEMTLYERVSQKSLDAALAKLQQPIQS